MDDQLAHTLARIADVLERLEAKLDMAEQPSKPEVLTIDEVCELLGLTRKTIYRYRKQAWIEGVHWWREGDKLLRFDRELLEDWRRNANNPAAHQRAIQAKAKTLLSNRKK